MWLGVPQAQAEPKGISCRVAPNHSEPEHGSLNAAQSIHHMSHSCKVESRWAGRHACCTGVRSARLTVTQSVRPQHNLHYSALCACPIYTHYRCSPGKPYATLDLLPAAAGSCDLKPAVSAYSCCWKAAAASTQKKLRSHQQSSVLVAQSATTADWRRQHVPRTTSNSMTPSLCSLGSLVSLAPLLNGALEGGGQLAVLGLQMVGFVVCLCSRLPHLQGLCCSSLPEPGLHTAE